MAVCGVVSAAGTVPVFPVGTYWRYRGTNAVPDVADKRIFLWQRANILILCFCAGFCMPEEDRCLVLAMSFGHDPLFSFLLQVSGTVSSNGTRIVVWCIFRYPRSPLVFVTFRPISPRASRPRYEKPGGERHPSFEAGDERTLSTLLNTQY